MLPLGAMPTWAVTENSMPISNILVSQYSIGTAQASLSVLALAREPTPDTYDVTDHIDALMFLSTTVSSAVKVCTTRVTTHRT